MALIDLMRISNLFGAELPPAFLGAFVSKSGAQSIVTATPTVLIWQTEAYDVGDWFASSGDSVFTVPAGVGRVRLSASVNWDGTVGTFRTITFLKNGSSALGLPASALPPVSVFQSLVSPIIEVVPGDTLSSSVSHDTGVNLDVLAGDTTFFSVEAVR